jgi:hypothetical protein
LQPQDSTVYIYLSAPGDDFETERRLFVDVVLTELRTRASAVGISLVAILPEEWPPGDRGLGRRLREIRDNRPLFVAFLGERAGQTEAIPDDFLADFTWLHQWHDSTAREIEIFFAHGVLEKRCFVYRRNADFIDEVPPEARDSYVPADAAEAAHVAVLSDQVRAKQTASTGLIVKIPTPRSQVLPNVSSTICGGRSIQRRLASPPWITAPVSAQVS